MSTTPKTVVRKTRVVQAGYNDASACDEHCGRRAQFKVQISTPNGRSYMTAATLCKEHRTAENIAWHLQAAEMYLDGEA